MSRSFFVFLHPFLNSVKQFFRNDSGDSVGNNDITILVFTHIPSVVKNTRNKVKVNVATFVCLCTEFIKSVTDFFHYHSVIVHLENIENNGCCQRINLIMFFFVNRVTVSRSAAVVFAFQGILRMTSDYLYCKFGRVIFCHTFEQRFENNSFGAFSNIFRCRYNFYAVSFERCFVVSTVVSVAGKSVEFPDDNHIEQAFCTVFNHLQKLGSVICLCGKRTVNVMSDNRDSVLVAILSTFSQLTLNGFFSLTFCGVSCIDNCFQSSVTSSELRSFRSVSLS